MNELEEALKYAQKAVEVDDELPDSLFNLAVLLERVNREQEAVKTYEQLKTYVKHEDFVKSRLEALKQRKQHDYENDFRKMSIPLNHPNIVMKESVKIYKKNKDNNTILFENVFKVVSTKRILQQSKSPGRQVRFLNIGSSMGSIEDRARMDFPLPLRPSQFTRPQFPDSSQDDKSFGGGLKNDQDQAKEEDSGKGKSILDILRRNEKEKLGDTPSEPIFDWKQRSRPKDQGFKNSLVNQDNKKVFKGFKSDVTAKEKNESEVSFGQNNMKKSEFLNMVQTYLEVRLYLNFRPKILLKKETLS